MAATQPTPKLGTGVAPPQSTGIGDALLSKFDKYVDIYLKQSDKDSDRKEGRLDLSAQRQHELALIRAQNGNQKVVPPSPDLSLVPDGKKSGFELSTKNIAIIGAAVVGLGVLFAVAR